jgi:branched-chain amino acid transport system ATP-binding protein
VSDLGSDILTVEDVSISFGGVRALSDVSMSVKAGEIVGVIGPNGAGKTTLLNVVSGMNTPDRGQVTLDGTAITGRKPSRIAGLGLGRTFQASQLFPGMSVLENMLTGLHLRSRAGLFAAAVRAPAMREEEAAMRARALEALEFVGLRAFAPRPGNALSFGQQRIVEIARTLISEPKVVLLDEPAVGLSLTRVAELDALLRRIRDERGVTLVMIEHVIRLVMGVSDRVVVLNSGQKIAEGRPEDIRRDPAVIEAYLGRHLDAERPAP